MAFTYWEKKDAVANKPCPPNNSCHPMSISFKLLWAIFKGILIMPCVENDDINHMWQDIEFMKGWLNKIGIWEDFL